MLTALALVLAVVLAGSVRPRFVDDLGCADQPIPFRLSENDETGWWE